MIGNDLVDLQLASKESNWQRKGYLQKVCTPEEQELILTSANPYRVFWTLWSMKESVYKIINSTTGIRNYSPVSYRSNTSEQNLHPVLRRNPYPSLQRNLYPSLQKNLYPALQRGFCTLRKPISENLTANTLSFSGRVIYQQQTFLTHTQISGQRLHTIAVSQSKDFDSIHTLFLNPGTYKNEVTDYTDANAGYNYPDHFNQSSHPYQLSKNKSGIPEITNLITGIKHPASVSHHGHYLAVIYSDFLQLTN